MKISIIVEGKTERVFIPYLRRYLYQNLSRAVWPQLDAVPYDGRIPSGDKLRRIVENLLNDRRNPSDHIIALTDVYTGTQPPDFHDAADAKRKMRMWVGGEERFHAHAAQYDFEAWLLPYWPTIQRLARHNRNAPSGNPENVNHGNPPAHRIGEMFEIGGCRESYVKPRDAGRILKDNDLSVAITQCSELKALVNTILSVAGGIVIP